MRYRRNMDERTRALERQFQDDISRSYDYAAALIRARQLPKLPPRWPFFMFPARSSSVSLEEYFQHIDSQYWMQYLVLILNLLKLGIAFELRPGGMCGCENSHCPHLTDNTLCFDCKSHSMVTYTDHIGSDIPAEHPLFADPDGRAILVCTKCKETRPAYAEGEGPCQGFSWRSYEDDIGGVCDDCMGNLPMEYHSHVCQCARCNDGIGPLILLRSRLVESDKLHRMLFAYNQHYADRRIVDSPFQLSRDDEYADEDWRRRDSNISPLDELALSCIELRRDGSYRLRKYQHLNERQIPSRFMNILQARLKDPVPQAAKELFYWHMLGRDFDLSGLIDHLASNSPPNMPQFINQVYRAVGEKINFDAIFHLRQIPPNLYHYECVGTWSPPPTDEDAFLQATLVEYPLRISFERTAMDDEVKFWLFGIDHVEQKFNTRLRIEDRPTLDRINIRLSWALDRAQHPPEGGEIQPGRLHFLAENMCPHAYQRGLYYECPYCPKSARRH